MKICFISLPKHIAETKQSPSVFTSPPITHLWLAAVLLEGGQSVSVLDAASLNMSEEEIHQAIACENPDLVGFTVFTNAYYDVVYMARRIKERMPKVRIAVGGYHVNSIPEDFYKDYIDYVFVGETEYSLLDLMNRLDAQDESKAGILGLRYYDTQRKEWIVNPPQGRIDNFDDMPIIPYELVSEVEYTSWWTTADSKHHKYMATITGKGCPMNCSFCDISKTEGRRYRHMSAERVLKEFTYLNTQLGVTHLELRDPLFTVHLKRVEEIAQGIIDRGLKLNWGFSSTIKQIRSFEFLQLLHRAGVRFIFYGVESGNPKTLKQEKKVTPKQVHQVVRWTEKAGIRAHCSFIFGLEGETAETMQQTLDFALGLNPNTASFSIAIPYPGTWLYDYYKQKGYIKTFDWRLYDGEQPVFETEQVSKEMLDEYLVKAHRSFYFRPKYILNRLAKVRSLAEFYKHASLGLNMLFDVTAYKR